MNSEQEWIERLRKGEGSALAWLMDRYGTDIHRTAALLLKDRHLAEDISQEVFLKAYQKIDQYSGEGSLKGWLIRIAVHLCRSKMRLASWKRLFFRDPAGQESVGTDSNIDQMIMEQSMWSYIQKVPYKYREVIVLYYYHSLSVREIGEVTGDKEGTVKSKLSRGRALLKDQLIQGGWTDEG
ncbi:RNA polymerase sigma factor [Paenibacillus sp. J2TS4]|uniref:RNA polymerase sigma factor n=1 Tax=Paenibacillus sp. J2TS4 TaxID=2807194 RepID=UPI001BCAB98B|nr:sigma-70 family RNA polymerase sigma factor [Paenibacillus sp. J2TS4]